MSSPFTPRRRYDLAGLSFMVAMPSHRDLPPQTAIALLHIQKEMLERGIPLSVEIDFGGSLVHHARTFMAWRFLQGNHSRLFWIDSDIVFTASDFLRIAGLSAVLPLVAGAYPAKRDPPLFMKRGEMVLNEEHRVISADGLGLGFTCMSREVVAAVADAAPKRKYHQFPEPIPRIFRLDGVTEDGADEGEDMAFFRDAKALGYQLWIDPTLSLGHVGPKVYSARLSDYLTKEK